MSSQTKNVGILIEIVHAQTAVNVHSCHFEVVH